MKKKAIVVLLFVASLMLLAACDNKNTEDKMKNSEGEYKSGYQVIKKTQVDANVDAYEIVHKETGCHQAVVVKDGGGVSITNIEVAEGKPYCTEPIK